MRVSLPAVWTIWAVAGALLVAVSLISMRVSHGTANEVFTVVLLCLSVWASVGVEALTRTEVVWRPRWRVIAFTAAAGLPMAVILAASSHCLVLAARHGRSPAQDTPPAQQVGAALIARARAHR